MPNKKPAKVPPKARRARATDVRDRNSIRLLQARAAVQSAILAIEDKGVMGEVAIMLRMSALNPLRDLEGLTHG